MKIATVEQMRSMDRHAIETLGIPEMILMENAGLAAVAVLDRETGIAGKRFVVLCGIGNNGGDGFVVARVIHSRGGRVKVFALGDTGKLQGRPDPFPDPRQPPAPVTRKPCRISAGTSCMPTGSWTPLRHRPRPRSAVCTARSSSF